jgi:hypothetical protein
VELINTIGTRVQVRDEHADRLIAAGYRRPDREPRHAKPVRRATTRSAKATPAVDTPATKDGP